MSSTQSSSSSLSSSYEDDLFKKFKLKHYRIAKNSDEVSSPEIDVEQVEFLTPDIDELQRQENDLLKSISFPKVNNKKPLFLNIRIIFCR
jgi:hypothetical protein